MIVRAGHTIENYCSLSSIILCSVLKEASTHVIFSTGIGFISVLHAMRHGLSKIKAVESK